MLGTTGSGFLLGERPIGSLDDYLAAGGGRGLEEAREIPIPKIVNLEDGLVTYDEATAVFSLTDKGRAAVDTP